MTECEHLHAGWNDEQMFNLVQNLTGSMRNATLLWSGSHSSNSKVIYPKIVTSELLLCQKTKCYWGKHCHIHLENIINLHYSPTTNITFVRLIKFSIHWGRETQREVCYFPSCSLCCCFVSWNCESFPPKIQWICQMLRLSPWSGLTIKNTSTPWSSEVWARACRWTVGELRGSGREGFFMYMILLSLSPVVLCCVVLWVRVARLGLERWILLPA